MGYVDDRIKKALSAAQAGQSGTTTTGATTGAQSGGYTQDRINRALQSASAAQQAQQRTQTIQSMQTKKAELDERKLGVSYAPAGYSQQPQKQPQYISPAPIVWTLDSAVNPIIKQNSKVSKQYATAMPSAPLIQQATEAFGKWNQQYEQDENRYLDNVDRVSTLSSMGTSDPEANRRLEQSSQKLDQTKDQQDAVVRQTLKMLGPGTEEFLKQRLEDAKTKEGTREKWLRANREHELQQELGSDLYGKLLDYTRRSEQAQKAEAEQEREQREVERKYNAYETLRYNEDFKEKSQYQSTANGKKEDVLTQLLGSGIKDSSSGWDDPLYEAVNGNQDAAAYLEERAANRYQADAGALGAIFGRAAEGKQEIKQMTSDEIGMFNYLYATKGKEAAHEYYDFLQSTALNKRQTEEEKKYWKQWSQEHQVKSSLFSVAAGPLKTLSYAGQAGDYIGSGKIDENAGYNSFARIPSTIRDTVSQKAEEKWGPAGSFLYQTGMSMADFLYNSAITGAWAGEAALGKEAFKLASNMSLAIMGSGAAADATIEAKERGLTDKQAFVLGTVAGAAEILTEKVSVESLLTGKWEESAIKFVLKNSLVEGSEEVGSNVINTIADILVAKDKSQWRQSIQAYRNSGLSEAEAFRRAMMDKAMEMGLDYLGGALSGGVMAGMQAWGNRGYWQAQQAPRQTDSTDTNQSGFQTNTQVQTPQDVQQNQAEQAQVNPAEVQRTQQNAQTAENTESAKLDEAMLSALRQIEQQKQAQGSQSQRTVKAQGPYDDLVEALRRGDVAGDQIAKYASGFDSSRSKDFIAWLDREVEEGRLKWRGDGKLGQVRGADDHIDNRDYGSVGARGVNAFQYNNPELHQYIAEGAEIFGGEVAASTPGERIYLGNNPNEAGATPMWTGTKRHTTPQIENLKDNYRMSWSDLQTAVDDLIADDGRENNANAKRVELAVDDILTNGTRLMDGTEIPPNQEYIAAKAGIAGGGTAASDVSSQDQLNGPIMAALNELNGKQGAEQNAESPGMQGVGAAESGYSGDVGTWKRDASELIKDTELPKQDKNGDTISDSAGSMFKANVPKETREMIERFAYEGEYSYGMDSNSKQAQRVHEAIEQDGFDVVYDRTVRDLMDHRATADTTAQAWIMFIQAANRGDSEKAATLSKLVAQYSTSVAQALQANSIYNKLTPEGRLAAIQKTVNRINQNVENSTGKKGGSGGMEEVQIDHSLMQEYLNAHGEEEIQAVEDKIYKNIAEQMPASLSEKARAWRYMSMLANPKTHINNLIGNVSMRGMRKAKDAIGALIELAIPQDQRTKSVGAGSELRGVAAADFENAKDMILGDSKYNDSANSKIQENRRIFNNDILEGIRVKNDELLNTVGDGVFAKANYVDAFAGILKARGYTAEDFSSGKISDAQLESMRSYAIKEAQKATFRDLNNFSRFVRDIGFKNTEGNGWKKAANVVVEGVLAFKKTPANVLARAYEYSPAGLLDTLARGSKQLYDGEISTSEYIDGISSGMTGTAIFGLGYLLGHMGLIKVFGDDDDQDKLEGRQNFSIEIGGKSFTLTFLSPMAMPLFMGAQLEQVLNSNSKNMPAMDKVLNVIKGLSDPILEMSMMSGLQDALEATSYADNKPLAFAVNSALSYLTQYVPAFGGQIKRTFQRPERTTTFVNEANPILNKDSQRSIGTVANKIPGPSYQQIPYIDAWGRRQDQGNIAERAFNNFINPSYVSEMKQTDVDREIRRLEKQTGENYTPNRADSTLTIDGKTVILTEDEYVTYAESKGQNDFEMRSNLIASDVYKMLDDYTKGLAMKNSKEYADNLAKKEIGLEFDEPGWMAELEGKTAEEVTDALISRAVVAEAGKAKREGKAGNVYDVYADKVFSGVPAETVLMALTDAQQENYSKYIQKAKVPAETYLDALSFASGAKSDKDKDGKTIAGSRKQKIVDWINGQKLTKRQKRALFLCFYSESDDTFK